MKKLILFLFYCFYYNLSFSNDCIKLTKSEIFNQAEVVFIGTILESNDIDYKLKVIERFKGSVPDTLFGLNNDNLIVPKKGTTWLIYTSKTENKRISIDPCSGSKSFEAPFGYHDITIFIPPSIEMLSSPNDLVVLEQILRNKSLNEMYFEVLSLRSNRGKEEMNYFLKRLELIEDKLLNIKSGFILILSLLSLSIILQFFLVFKWIKKI